MTVMRRLKFLRTRPFVYQHIQTNINRDIKARINDFCEEKPPMTYGFLSKGQ